MRIGHAFDRIIDRTARRFVKHPFPPAWVADPHGAQPQPRYREVGGAEISILHLVSPLPWENARATRSASILDDEAQSRNRWSIGSERAAGFELAQSQSEGQTED
jgi:hypothetical protein